MITSQKMRTWATPLTAGAFALSAATGVMMFFHVDIGLVKPVHEWFSWFLVIGGLFHLAGSWQPFVGYFSKPASKVIMAVFVLWIAVSFFPIGKRDKGMPPGKMSRILSRSSVAAVAVVAEHTPEEAVKELESKGIRVEAKEQSIQEIAARNNKRGIDILNLIF